MPATVGSLVAFLLLITPGLVFELLRENSRPGRVRSTFRETSVIVVASVVFSSVALFVLVIARAVHDPWIPSPSRLIDSPGSFASERPLLVARTLALHQLLACGAAYLSHRILCHKRPGGRISPNPAWFEIVHGNANPRRDQVLLFVELQDGSAVRGLVKGYDLGADQSLRTLVLCGSASNPLTTRQAATGVESRVGSDWAYIVVAAEEIKLATIALVAQ